MHVQLLAPLAFHPSATCCLPNAQVYASQGFYDMTGFSREEVIGHNW